MQTKQWRQLKALVRVIMTMTLIISDTYDLQHQE
jgi:hypothetical protein